MRELGKIPGMCPFDSQANYVMVRVDGSLSSRQIQERLLVDYNILVKDLSSKTGGRSYLRLAIRTQDENDLLLGALGALA